MRIAEFITENGITLKSVPIGLHIIDGKTPFMWLVTITYNGKEFTTEYTMGAAHVTKFGKPIDYSEIKLWVDKIRWREISFHALKAAEPKLDDVIYSLKMDANSIEQNPLWEDFASDLGLNDDSRKDYKVFEACQVIYGNMRKLFGNKFQQFLECEE